jgi:hypothetical protein
MLEVDSVMMIREGDIGLGLYMIGALTEGSLWLRFRGYLR